MANNIIAFVGIDNFDNIFYISKILSAVGKRVLLIDHSDTLAIKHSIPLPDGVECSKELVTYRNIDFTTKILTTDMMEEYDDIFLAYGFNEPLQDIVYCNRIVYVLDLYRYNQERLICIMGEKLPKEVEKELIVKGVLDTKLIPELVAEKIDNSITKEGISVLLHDERDEANALLCHHNRMFCLRGISRQRKNYLSKVIRGYYPEISNHTVRAAFRQSKRRNLR